MQQFTRLSLSEAKYSLIIQETYGLSWSCACVFIKPGEVRSSVLTSPSIQGGKLPGELFTGGGGWHPPSPKVKSTRSIRETKVPRVQFVSYQAVYYEYCRYVRPGPGPQTADEYRLREKSIVIRKDPELRGEWPFNGVLMLRSWYYSKSHGAVVQDAAQADTNTKVCLLYNSSLGVM